MRTLRSRAVAAVAVVALALSPALTACGQAAEQVAEQAAEQAIGGDVELNDEGVTVTDEEGNEVAIGEDVAVPDTWPADVPLYEGGTLQMVSVQADGAATAMWLVDGTPADVAASYGAALESAGFTADSESTMGGMVVNTYTGNGLTVSMQVLESDGQTSLMVIAEPAA